MPDLRALAGAVVAAAGVLLAAVWLFQRPLVYFPLERSVPPVAAALPGAQEVAFRTADGLELRGWYLPARQPVPRAAVLVFNGNAGDRSYRTPLAEALAGQGLAVLLFDYRGYGGNPGTPSETGLLADARAARAALTSRDGVDPGRIVYFGESLGAAAAVALAVEQPPAALVLRSPFTSLGDMARFHYPLLPAGPFLRDRYPAIEQIAQVTVPLLVVAGSRDRIVPVEQSRRLYEAAREPKRFVLVEGADHNDLDLLAGAKLIEEVVRFVEQYVSAGQAG